LVEQLSALTGLDPIWCLIACLGIVFTVAGAVVGSLFVSEAFVWSFLLTYLLLRLLGPPGWVTALTLSMWTGGVAGWAARMRERRTTLV
jgi:hypothetical protein